MHLPTLRSLRPPGGRVLTLTAVVGPFKNGLCGDVLHTELHPVGVSLTFPRVRPHGSVTVVKTTNAPDSTPSLLMLFVPMPPAPPPRSKHSHPSAVPPGQPTSAGVPHT